MPLDERDKRQERVHRLQKKWAQLDDKEIDDAIRAIVKHAQGRRFIYWLFDISRAIGVNPFSGNALATSFACGEQNVGQRIMARLLEVSPESFLTMLKEIGNERDQRNTITATVLAGGDPDASDAAQYPDYGPGEADTA